MDINDVLKEYYDAKADHRIVPYFQPVFSVRKGTIVSAEVLCRLKKRNGEIVTPEGFIPTLERTGEICDLDWYMVERACAFALNMDVEYGEEIKVSVNLSRRHVNEWDAVQHLCSIADSYCVDHSRIEIEITEGYKPHDILLIHMINRIREEGFTVAVDDFGKGYSSIGFVKEAGFETIKTDKDLIGGDIYLDNTEALIRGILEISKNIGVRFVAEGVETKDQMEFLLLNGCDYMQGNYFSEPVREENFIQLYKEVAGITGKEKKKKGKRFSIVLPELPAILD